jgi:hypothetical protein
MAGHGFCDIKQSGSLVLEHSDHHHNHDQKSQVEEKESELNGTHNHFSSDIKLHITNNKLDLQIKLYPLNIFINSIKESYLDKNQLYLDNLSSLNPSQLPINYLSTIRLLV